MAIMGTWVTINQPIRPDDNCRRGWGGASFDNAHVGAQGLLQRPLLPKALIFPIIVFGTHLGDRVIRLVSLQFLINLKDFTFFHLINFFISCLPRHLLIMTQLPLWLPAVCWSLDLGPTSLRGSTCQEKWIKWHSSFPGIILTTWPLWVHFWATSYANVSEPEPEPRQTG